MYSIVVPAYNVEKYLDECIASVLSNSFEDFEVILIDDGSSDNTSLLVDKWAKRDPRIKTVHQENGGLSIARNKGLSIAGGVYVVFLDADDCLAPWALTDLARAINEASEPDVVLTEMLNVQDVSIMPPREDVICASSSHFSKDEAFNYVFWEKPHTWPAPQYLIKRSFIKRAGLSFASGILHEDICWTAEVMASAETFAAYSHPWYLRRYGRVGSITNSVNVRHITDVVRSVRLTLESPGFLGLTEGQAELLKNRLARSLFPSLRQYRELDAAAKEIASNWVECNIDLYSLSHKFTHRLFVFTCKTLGAKRALCLLPPQ